MQLPANSDLLASAESHGSTIKMSPRRACVSIALRLGHEVAQDMICVQLTSRSQHFQFPGRRDRSVACQPIMPPRSLCPYTHCHHRRLYCSSGQCHATLAAKYRDTHRRKEQLKNEEYRLRIRINDLKNEIHSYCDKSHYYTDRCMQRARATYDEALARPRPSVQCRCTECALGRAKRTIRDLEDQMSAAWVWRESLGEYRRSYDRGCVG